MIGGYGVYVFDIDGTVLNTAPGILGAVRKALAECGFSVPQEQITDDLIGPKIGEIVDILGVTSDPDVKAKVVAAFRRIYDADPVTDTVFYPRGKEILDFARAQNVPLFVATNKPNGPTQLVLDAFKLDGFVDVYCPNKYPDIVLTKADMLREIAEKYGYAPSDMLMIGDTMGDFKAARECGCDFAFATWGYEKDKKTIARQAEIVLE